jgi:hypothetical protein
MICLELTGEIRLYDLFHISCMWRTAVVFFWTKVYSDMAPPAACRVLESAEHAQLARWWVSHFIIANVFLRARNNFVGRDGLNLWHKAQTWQTCITGICAICVNNCTCVYEQVGSVRTLAHLMCSSRNSITTSKYIYFKYKTRTVLTVGPKMC